METASWTMPRMVASTILSGTSKARQLGLMTLDEYTHTRFEDPRLIGLLESQWMNYGVEPKSAAFAMHAIVVNHYLRGAWFPVGGGEALVDALRRVIENGGGQCLTGHRVDEILVERNRAVGVRGHSAEADREFEVRAPAVISNAGARITFDTLLPRRPFPEISDALAAQPSSPGTLAVFLGLKASPATLGVGGENHWIVPSYDHDYSYLNDQNLVVCPDCAFVTFPSLKDPSSTSHTASVTTLARLAPWEAWKDLPPSERGDDYEALKREAGQILFETAERSFPGLHDLIEHIEVLTPLDVRDATGNLTGGFAELPCTPARLEQRLAPAKSPVKGLFLAGGDAAALGVIGAAMGGAQAAAAVQGPLSVASIFNAARKQATRNQSGSRPGS